MQSNRIISIQKQAKRRAVALAIVTSAIAGYGAFTVSADDDRPVQLTISKMGTAPGVKAVGIRLISSSGESSKLPAAPSSQLQALPPGLLPPPASLGSVIQMPAIASPALNIPELGAPLYTSLPTPPRMSEIQPPPPVGKVTMKLNGVEGTGSSVTAQQLPAKFAPVEQQAMQSADAVEIRVVPNRSMGQPAKMPPFLIDSTSKRAVPEPETTRHGSEGSNQFQSSAIRMSVVDKAENGREVPPKSRTPQLVKPKTTQIDYTVSLAQSTQLESRSLKDTSEQNVPPVEVDASLVPHSISTPGKPNKPKGNFPQAVITDAVADAFVAIAPPAKDLQIDTELRSSQSRSNNSNSLLNSSSDSSRRKFDARPAYQSAVANVELECLTATTMDMAGKLVAIAVQDETVCKAMMNERTVSFVGNQVGSTLIQLWTTELGDKPQVIRVNVFQQGGKFLAKSTEVKDIKQVIAQGFPKANVSISSTEDGGIEVRGTTDSEESARRILELVRKLYLVPVKDKLIVSN